jgi:A/G-specific adenine glycosylase
VTLPLPPRFPVEGFRTELIAWYRVYGRRFPWRETREPYAVLIAEVLLHRTRADQVRPLYQAFLEAYPDLNALAGAQVDALHSLLRPAGLRWRVDLLHAMAAAIRRRFDGVVPSDEKELNSLPGVGHYIAGAVRCFAYGFPDAILDTNTVRVTGRVVGLPVKDSSRRSTRFRRILEALVDLQNPRDFNFALLDLAAAICTPRDPRCTRCPLLPFCATGQSRMGAGSPVS